MKDEMNERPSPPNMLHMTKIVEAKEAEQLLQYLREQKKGTMRQHILDWLGTQPQILERMNANGLLLSYFSHVLEHATLAALAIMAAKHGLKPEDK